MIDVIARLLVCVGVLAALSATAAHARSDLDELMARVLARRDENWRKLRQYVLEERESLQVIGPSRSPLFGFRRDYQWFVRDGVFVRSPLRADGVTIGDDERRRAEDAWTRNERRRERQRGGADAHAAPPGTATTPDSVRDVLRQTVEPRFVSHAYFLRFKFDPGRYALTGRERRDDREVLRIEYYPTKLFAEGRLRPNRKLRRRDGEVEDKMNKSSLVTLWVDPATHQILQYDFDNIGMEFLPGRSLVRIGAVRASMQMGQPFEGVWLPRSVAMRFDALTALGALTAQYQVEYHEYRLAEVTTRIR